MNYTINIYVHHIDTATIYSIDWEYLYLFAYEPAGFNGYVNKNYVFKHFLSTFHDGF
jgi:hypothetical protein